MRFEKRLHQESELWVEAGFIDRETQELILEQYPQKVWPIEFILMACASVFVTCSLFLLLAHNWAYLGQTVQFATVLSGLILILTLRDVLSTRNQEAAVAALDLLSPLAGGVGIWLTAQIFHIGGHYPDGLWLWAVMATGMAILRPRTALILLSLGLCGWWMFSEYYSFHSMGLSAAILLIVLGYLIHERRQWSFFLLFYAALWHMFFSHLVHVFGHHRIWFEHEIASVYLLCVLLSLIRTRIRVRSYDWPIVPSTLIRVLSVWLFLFSFEDFARVVIDVDYQNPYAWMLLTAYSLLIMLMMGRALLESREDPEPRVILPCMTFLIFLGSCLVSSITTLSLASILMAVLSTITLFVLGLFLLRTGARLKSQQCMREGVVLLILLAVARYIEYFGEYLHGSFFFFLLAALLVWAARKMREIQ